MTKKDSAAGDKLIVKNRRATFDYHVERRLEAGLQLLGTEVKSLRNGQVNLSDSYAAPQKGELFLVNCNIAPYASSGQMLNHAPLRPRKLILHRKEIDELTREVNEKGFTLVPLSLYWRGGRAKAEIGLCRGKTHGDRREAIQEREVKREIDRAMRGGRKPGRRGDD
jgi:SsrA-binding protein